MREIGAFEAKNKFGQLLDWVANGEEVTITRHGKEVACLVLAKQGFNRDEARRRSWLVRVMLQSVDSYIAVSRYSAGRLSHGQTFRRINFYLAQLCRFEFIFS